MRFGVVIFGGNDILDTVDDHKSNTRFVVKTKLISDFKKTNPFHFQATNQ